jgi:hypothetical protein
MCRHVLTAAAESGSSARFAARKSHARILNHLGLPTRAPPNSACRPFLSPSNRTEDGPYARTLSDEPVGRAPTLHGRWPTRDRQQSCENQLRVVAVGRKNWLFAGSFEGARRAALLYSLVQSGKRIDVQPFDYLKDVLLRVATHRTR